MYPKQNNSAGSTDGNRYGYFQGTLKAVRHVGHLCLTKRRHFSLFECCFGMTQTVTNDSYLLLIWSLHFAYL